MLGKIIKHELRLLREDKTAWIVVVCFALIIGFAVLNRSREVEKQKTSVEKFITGINEDVIRREQKAAREIERKIEAGEYKDETPLVWNARHPRHAAAWSPQEMALPPAPLAVLAVGRSDLDSIAYKIQTNPPRESFAVREQTDYPLNLLIGHLDLAFVMLYLYPLFILTLSFNLISAEREDGTLLLLLSQPLSIRTLVLGKILARGALIFGATIAFSFIFLLLSAINFTDSTVIVGMVFWLLAILAYGIFWFGLALIANYGTQTSASCALALITGWFVLAILLPATINLLAASIFPVPSRTEFINARRGISFEIRSERQQKFDQRIKNFLAAHPEYPPDWNYGKPALEWMQTAQENIELAEKMQPIKDRFDGQFERQKRLIKYLSVLSPLTVTQNLLPEIAGTGQLRYQSFLAQIDDYQREWRKMFWNKPFFGETMTAAEYDLIPRFRFLEVSIADLFKETLFSLSTLIIQAALVISCGLYKYRSYSVVG